GTAISTQYASCPFASRYAPINPISAYCFPGPYSAAEACVALRLIAPRATSNNAIMSATTLLLRREASKCLTEFIVSFPSGTSAPGSLRCPDGVRRSYTQRQSPGFGRRFAFFLKPGNVY